MGIFLPFCLAFFFKGNDFIRGIQSDNKRRKR